MITPDGSTRELLYGRVSGPYRFLPEPAVEDHPHARPVEWLGRRDRDLLPDRALFSLGSTLTVFPPAFQQGIARFLATGDVHVELFEGGGVEVTEEEADPTSADEQEHRNRELIAKKIRDLGWEETQELVAGVLRAMGYSTQVSPIGADGASM